MTRVFKNTIKDLAMLAVRDALDTCSTYPEKVIDGIMELVDFCLNNSVIHYRNKWYRSEEGIPTGGPESGAIANIYVKWMMDNVLLVDSTINDLNFIVARKRFLDDLFFLWLGSEKSFLDFKDALNEKGSEFKFTLKGEVGKTVDFLDVRVSNESGKLETTLFVKPTDSMRYLHRRSDHSPHMFKAIPYSQFRRAVVICSSDKERDLHIDRMKRKFLDSGYYDSELDAAKTRALKIDRKSILKTPSSASSDPIQESPKTDNLTFVINHDPQMARTLKSVLSDHSADLQNLIQDTKIIISERRNPNTASLLFAKSSFSKTFVPPKPTQKCSHRNCLTCGILNLPKNLKVNGFSIKLDFSLNCKVTNCIYLAICKHCENPNEFYVGQTCTALNERMSGHRSSFKTGKQENSALAIHTFNKHLDHFDKNLRNFNVGIIKEVPPKMLDRVEDYFIYYTKAESQSLNRNKVVR